MPRATHQASEEESRAATAWLRRHYEAFVASGHKRVELDRVITARPMARGRAQLRAARPSTVPLDRILDGHVPMPNVLQRFAAPFGISELALLALFGYRREVLKAASQLIFAGNVWVRNIDARLDPIRGMAAVSPDHAPSTWETQSVVRDGGTTTTVALRLPFFTSLGIGLIVLSLPLRGEVRTPDWDRPDRLRLMDFSNVLIGQAKDVLDRAHVRNPLPGVLRLADSILQRSKDISLEARIAASAELARDYCRSISILATLDVEKSLYGVESALRPTLSDFHAK